ncbi:ATP-grasp domain-containing protein [Kordiimonas pumila]|uniref:ATP-grasp domain-containing protein n=1 Tax=Kordiimonas pumila TaxID=2161677 RepID=A0ABV7D3C2_9PROT|nr:ATP-grasp domain-containing protein [Kordiimonas pumila]
MKKRLLLLGGGFEQLNALRIAQELGAEVIVFDGHETAACAFEACEFYQVNIKDHAALIAKAKELRLDAVFVHAAELAIECALVAEAVGLPGISVESAKLGTDKTLRAACLLRAGVRIPKYQPLTAASDWSAWRNAGDALGYPIIAKPTKLAGAQGVEFIPDEIALQRYFEGKQSFKAQDFLLEEFLQGTQLSTESVALDGALVCTSIALRHYDTTQHLWPHQIEDGHSMPYDASLELQNSIDDVTEKCRAAFGIETGVLKGDLIISPSGEIIVLEMAVRTSGGRFCDTVVPVSTGVNILYPLIQYALGQTPDPAYLKADRHVGVSQRFVLIPEGNRLKEYKTIQHILLQEDVIGWWFRDDLQDLAQAPKIMSHRDRIGYVICSADTRDNADKRAQTIVEQLVKAITLETLT